MSKNCVSCALCDQFLVKPVQTTCGHNVCAICTQGNLSVIKKIKNGKDIGTCKHCQKPVMFLGHQTDINRQFDQLLKECCPDIYLERTKYLDRTKLIPQILLNFSKSKMSKKMLLALTNLFQIRFDKKKVYFLDQIVEMLTEMISSTTKQYTDLNNMVRFFLLMLLSMENNPLSRLDIRSFSINGLGIKKPIWCMFHKNMWETYLSANGDNPFDPLDIEFILLIQYIVNDKVCPEPREKTKFAKRLLEVAVSNNKVTNPSESYSNEASMIQFLTNNIELISTDPDFEC